jgi:GNAT superfamily N-acetyltransferase
MGVVIQSLTDLPTVQLAELIDESERLGFRFLRRLAENWATGANRFDRPGETLFGAFEGAKHVGVCGLNADPYAGGRVGRVRHLYVLSSHRRRGIGRQLVESVIEYARPTFVRLRLRTNDASAARFYEALGFKPTPGEGHCTHALDIVPERSPQR